jgi:hypothetical protein
MPVQTVIKHRTDTSANWTSVNPVLGLGEFGVVQGTNTFKIGDGSTQWVNLPYPSLQGLQGLQGITGSTGLQGFTGTIGLQGFTGIQGAVGLQGSQGSGLQGIQGTIGLQGASGSTGLTGIQGLQGLQGATGSVGNTGLQGAVGTQGTLGLQGLQGTTGATGLQGVQGIQGFGYPQAQGTQGTQGLTGSVGNTGLQGIQGSLGNTGAQGTQGLLGLQGFQGIQGFGYPQAQGTQGTQGVQGSYGPIGVQGFNGTTGAQGLTGAQGTTGTQGLTGTTGLQGIQGLLGAQGIQGTTGNPTEFYYSLTSDTAYSSISTLALFPGMSTGLSLDTSSIYQFEIYAMVKYYVNSTITGAEGLSYEALFSTPTAYANLNYRYEYGSLIGGNTSGATPTYPSLAPSSTVTYSLQHMNTATAATSMGVVGPAISVTYGGSPGLSKGAYGLLRVVGSVTTTSTSGAKLLPQIKLVETGGNGAASATLLAGSYIKAKKLASGLGGSW